ncbi:MAG: MBL fold metallo-hydrolase [Chitinophagales bacterium]|nr:MBL fold metallo-hydrolase [Chitinophagales bacterium]
MIKVRKLEYEDVVGARFSVIKLNRNLQTVYAYHLGDTLIDTGQSNSRNEVYHFFSDYKITKIILTHRHEDHTGNAAYLSEKWKVPVYAHPIAGEVLRKGYKVSPLGKYINGEVDKVNTLPIYDGQKIDIGVCTLEAIFTPGHTTDHISFYSKEKGWLFSGDLYVADRIKYFGVFESMKQQIESLKKLCQLEFEILFCSHNPKLKDGRFRLQTKLNDLEDFYGIVLEFHQKGYGFEEILNETGRKENKLYRFFTRGTFDSTNMVKSVLKDEGILKS